MSDTSKQFEKDVWNFVKALDSSAEVLFNHKVPDKDTGYLRQVDVWINAKLGGHFPLSILVSCKNHKRKLNVTHIESFAEEVLSTRASTGIIYSSSGFTRPAIAKTLSQGLSCCRLFRNEPADIPQYLVFWAYSCMSQIAISLIEPDATTLKEKGIIYWNDILSMQVTETETLLNHIAIRFHESEKRAVNQQPRQKLFPEDWGVEYTFSPSDDSSLEIKIRIFGHWKTYRGRVESHLLNGSYCFSNNSFHGTMTTPYIDTKGSHPGPGWEEINKESISVPDSRILMVLYHANIEEVVRQGLGNKLIACTAT